MRWAKQLPSPNHVDETVEGGLFGSYLCRLPITIPHTGVPARRAFMITREVMNDRLLGAKSYGGVDFPVGSEATLVLNLRPLRVQLVIILDVDLSRSMYMIAQSGKIGRLLFWRRRTYRYLHKAYFALRWKLTDRTGWLRPPGAVDVDGGLPDDPLPK